MNVKILFKNYPQSPYIEVENIVQIRIVKANDPKKETYLKNEECLNLVPMISEVYTFKGSEKSVTVFGSEIFCVEFTNI